MDNPPGERFPSLAVDDEWDPFPPLSAMSISQPAKPFPFFSLPRELRDEIYEQCLVFRGQIILQLQRVQFERATHDFDAAVHPGFADYCFWTPLNGSHLDHMLQPAKFRPYVSLLRTCKRMHEEGASVLYGLNRFTVFGRDNGSHDVHQHYGVIEGLDYAARPIIEKWISLQNMAYIRHMTIHIHSWPMFNITMPFLHDLITDSKTVLGGLPGVQKLRIILRASTSASSLKLRAGISDGMEGDGLPVDPVEELICPASRSHEEHVDILAKWLADHLWTETWSRLLNKIEIRLIHPMAEGERDVLLLTQALQRAKNLYLNRSLSMLKDGPGGNEVAFVRLAYPYIPDHWTHRH